jgi:hypothetical protein
MSNVTPTLPGEYGNRSELARLLRRYGQSGKVRDRMIEFLGGADLEEVTAAYIAGHDGSSDFGEVASPAYLPQYLEAGLEIDRSLWDRDFAIAHIDLEYHNFDNPAVPWLNPERALRLQQPVLDEILQVLGGAGISPLTLLTGRGFHLVYAVHRDSRAFRRLVGLGRLPPSLVNRYARPCSPSGLSVELDLGRAFAGLGLVMEFVWHRVLKGSEKDNALSVQPAAIEVGPGSHGREIIALDLSEYGDPLHTRQIRVPFSTYLKPRHFEWLLGKDGVQQLLPIFEIPLSGMTPLQAAAAARNPDTVLELSRHASVAIPNASEPMHKLLDEYQASELRAFHDQFYGRLGAMAASPVDPHLRILEVPACVQWLFEHPNDALLKPAALQHVVRVLMALDWNPSSIAQLICNIYLRDCGWRETWARLDPCNRAIFYTRLFAGMIVTGRDKLIDFNCVSHQEKGYCMVPECRSNLITYRDMLHKRRSH